METAAKRRVLFIGESMHGRVMELGLNMPTVQAYAEPEFNPASEYDPRVPLMTKMPDIISYARRVLAVVDEGERRWSREVYVPTHYTDERARYELAEYLIDRWVREG